MGKMDKKIINKKKKNKHLTKNRHKFKATDFEVTLETTKMKALKKKPSKGAIDDEDINVELNVCPISKKNKRSKRTKKQFGFQDLETVIVPDANIANPFRCTPPVIYGHDENTLGQFLKSAELVASRLEPNDERTDPEPYETTGSIKLTPIENGEIVVIDANSTIYVYGLVEVTVLFGTVEIFGKTLKRGNKVRVYSPRGASFLSFLNKGTDEPVDNVVLRECGLGDVTPGAAVLACRKIEETATKFLEENSAQILYPNNKDGTRWHLRNYVKKNWNTFKYNEEWEAIIRNVTDNSKVMFFGGKGVGKSTLLRYLVNRLLDSYGKICVVDLDPGQSEFTVPGCVSIVMVDEPLLGPNYTHLRRPERCIFVPDISVTSDLTTYLSAAKALIADLHRYKGIPTLINTMGYTRGMGLNIAGFLIDQLRPTTVVQIDRPDDAAVNFERDLRPDSPSLHYHFIKVASVSRYQSNWKMMPRQIRELCIYSYFGRVLHDNSEYLTDRRVTVYRVNLDDITVICNGAECNPATANANIVAMCTRDFLEDDCRLFECVGWGIVRGLSSEYSYLAVLTPIAENVLEDVKYLVVGSVTLPPSIHLRNHGSVRGLVPHVYKGELRDFAKIPKRTFAGQLET